jgi:ABC-type nickel/cobalt efflux system permease component RcnA
MQVRSFYLGGDAHIYYASREYVFDRPPNLDGGTPAAASSSSSFGSRTTATTANMSQSMEGASNTVSSSGVATCAAGGLSSAYLAYETAEFAPWEEILLDATAWMIAIVLCWDPMRGHQDLEEYQNDRQEEDNHRQQHHHHHRDTTIRRNRQRPLVGKNQETHQEKDYHNNQSDDQEKKN